MNHGNRVLRPKLPFKSSWKIECEIEISEIIINHDHLSSISNIRLQTLTYLLN